MSKFTFPVDYTATCGTEIELTVTYTVTPFIEATRLQPAEGGEVEIVAIEHEGREFDVPSDFEDVVYEMACERSRADLAEYEADRADYLYDQYRDRMMERQWEARGEKSA